MSKVALVLESEETSEDDLEEILYSLKPMIAQATQAKSSVVILEEGEE